MGAKCSSGPEVEVLTHPIILLTESSRQIADKSRTSLNRPFTIITSFVPLEVKSGLYLEF